MYIFIHNNKLFYSQHLQRAIIFLFLSFSIFLGFIQLFIFFYKIMDKFHNPEHFADFSGNYVLKVDYYAL